jgi:uncharacterized protein (TIGR02646 family)
MRFIEKRPEPEEFARWKEAKLLDPHSKWRVLVNPVKRTVLRSLLEEQGYICCYCGERINLKNSHIEHLKPKRFFQDLALDYTNLLASCQGGIDEAPPRQIHCGHKKGDWYNSRLLVSPLNPECETYFRYTSAGEILPGGHPQKRTTAAVTIRKLGLATDRLIAARRRALQAILEIIDTISEEEGRQLISELEKTDSKGRNSPFCEAVVSVLRKYFPD